MREYATVRRFLGATSDDVVRIAGSAVRDRPGIAHRPAHAVPPPVA
ncbi:hypothetical protein [Pseudonocardia alni]|nr:hypothetical protein [Pseudonocardia alni]